MNRRDFIKATGLGAMAVANTRLASGAPSLAEIAALDDESPKPINTKVKVKPVFGYRGHKGAYGGPCRWESLSSMAPDKERAANKSWCDRFLKSVKNSLPNEAVMLEPAVIELKRSWLEYPKADMISPEDWKKIEAGLPDVDLFLTAYRVPGIERYKVPLATVGRGPSHLDMAAFPRNTGVESHLLFDWGDLKRLVRLMQIRKAIRQSKILSVTDRPGSPPCCGLSCASPELIKQQVGIDYKYVSYKEFFAEMDRVVQDKTEQEKVKKITDAVINNAAKVHMKKEFIKNDVDFYLAVRNTMKKYGCSAFTIECFELCGSKISAERRFVPCLAHALLKDQGYVGSCEGDTNALLSNIFSICTAKRSVYMGNPTYSGGNRLQILHDAASLKMKGLDQPDSPYEIRYFTAEGWGTTIRYKFEEDKGQVVTLSRANPVVKNRLLLTKATIVGGGGFDSTGCSLRVHLELPNAKEFFYKQADFGQHLTMVYGDYTKDLRQVADLMGFETVEVC